MYIQGLQSPNRHLWDQRLRPDMAQTPPLHQTLVELQHPQRLRMVRAEASGQRDVAGNLAAIPGVYRYSVVQVHLLVWFAFCNLHSVHCERKL